MTKRNGGQKPKTKPRRARRRIWETVKSVAVTVAFAWVFTNHIAQATVVPTVSMTPSILVGDHFFIDKMAFPANYPELVRSYLPNRTIERGDVMALWSPEDPDIRLVKRVIGLPGETLEIRGWDVFIDEQRVDEPYTVHVNPIPGHRHDFGPVLIPENSYFMMGDNRDNSNDSRSWSFASHDELIGRALFIYWSYESPAYDPTTWSIADRAKHYGSVAFHFFTRTRWKRTGTPLW